jgi:hypothetical protein
LVTLIAAPIGFHWLGGIPGFIGGWTLGNLSAVIVLDWQLIRHGVPVARQDVIKTILLFAFVAAGRVLQHFFVTYIGNPSLNWIADLLAVIVISLVGAVAIFYRNRHFVFVRSGAV